MTSQGHTEAGRALLCKSLGADNLSVHSRASHPRWEGGPWGHLILQDVGSPCSSPVTTSSQGGPPGTGQRAPPRTGRSPFLCTSQQPLSTSKKTGSSREDTYPKSGGHMGGKPGQVVISWVSFPAFWGPCGLSQLSGLEPTPLTLKLLLRLQPRVQLTDKAQAGGQAGA